MQPLLNNAIKEIEQISLKLEKDKHEAMKSQLKIEDEKRIVDIQTAEVSNQY